MRKWVDAYLTELANEDSNVRLLIADVGDFPMFSNTHPDKFLNVGVSESNCIGVAAGMSYEGLRVFIYGVSSFFLYRAYEQFKYSLAYWNRNVTFIGVGFGWKYYNIGVGHFCPDDISLVKNLPNFSVCTPFTLNQLRNCLRSKTLFPRYLRITSNFLDDGINTEYQIGTSVVTVVTYGEMAKVCNNALLANKRTGAGDIGIILLDSLDDEILSLTAERLVGKNVVVVEDHICQGGLYSRLMEKGANICEHINLPLNTDKVAMNRLDLVREYGMDADSIIKRLDSIY